MTKPWKCYCDICKEKIFNFSLCIIGRTTRQDMIFNEKFGIIARHDIEYFTDEKYELIYDCKCGKDHISYFTSKDIGRELARNKNILELLNDFNLMPANKKLKCGDLIFEQI
jgi:hypothetical protein